MKHNMPGIIAILFVVGVAGAIILVSRTLTQTARNSQGTASQTQVQRPGPIAPGQSAPIITATLPPGNERISHRIAVNNATPVAPMASSATAKPAAPAFVPVPAEPSLPPAPQIAAATALLDAADPATPPTLALVDSVESLASKVASYTGADVPRIHVLLGRLRDLQKRPGDAIVAYTQALQTPGFEAAGEAAWRLGNVHIAADNGAGAEYARDLFRRVHEGALPASKKVRGAASLAYARFLIRDTTTRDRFRPEAIQIALDLENGATPAEREEVQRARLFLGFVYCQTLDYEKAYRAFSRVDFAGPEFTDTDRANVGVQRAWTHLEVTRMTMTRAEPSTEFTWDRCRALCRAVTEQFDRPGAAKAVEGYMRSAEVMFIQSHWYEKRYAEIPPLADAFVARWWPREPRTNPEAMARYWKLAAQHRMKQYAECLATIQAVYDAQFPEKAIDQFMQVRAYMLLTAADCEYALGRTDVARSRFNELNTRFPKFVASRGSRAAEFPVIAAFVPPTPTPTPAPASQPIAAVIKGIRSGSILEGATVTGSTITLVDGRSVSFPAGAAISSISPTTLEALFATVKPANPAAQNPAAPQAPFIASTPAPAGKSNDQRRLERDATIKRLMEERRRKTAPTPTPQ